MDRRLLSRNVLLLVLLLVPAAPLFADYVIYTRDGSRILARDKPVVQGKLLIFLTPLGTQQSIALTDWDQERTEKANEAGLGGAYVLDSPDTKTKVIQNPTDQKKPSLSEYIRTHKKNDLDVDKAAAESQNQSNRIIQTTKPAARPTAAAEVPANLLEPQVADVFSRAFDQVSLKGAKFVPIPSGVRVQAITENEQQIFGALTAAARGLKEARAYGRAVDRAEIWLATSTGEAAGRFVMSPEDADALLNNRITPAKYFVANVLF